MRTKKTSLVYLQNSQVFSQSMDSSSREGRSRSVGEDRHRTMDQSFASPM